jgi:hypothetical protein
MSANSLAATSFATLGCNSAIQPVVTEAGDCQDYTGGYEEMARQDSDLWLYRERTIALLRRYLRISIEVGRLPSILGRELFRSKVTSYKMASFEDGVIFVHDVERALDQLDAFPMQLVAMVLFEDYTHEETARILRCGRRTVSREFPLAIDCISEFFLEGGLLNRLPPVPVEKTCQEGGAGDFESSDCKQGE